MKHKVGLIGCGGIANQKHLPALKNASDRVEIVAFCDLIIERAERPPGNTASRGRWSAPTTTSCWPSRRSRSSTS